MYSNSETPSSSRNLPSTYDFERRLSSFWTYNHSFSSSGHSQIQHDKQNKQQSTYPNTCDTPDSSQESTSPKNIQQQTSLEATTKMLLPENNDSYIDSDTIPFMSLPGTFELTRRLQSIHTPITRITSSSCLHLKAKQIPDKI
jgi:hypothetical protein